MSTGKRTVIIAALQVLLVFAALSLAWMIRFDFHLPYFRVALTVFPVLAVVRLAALARFNLLHGYWRYTGMNDAIDVAKASVLGTIGFVFVVRYVMGMRAFPRGVYLIEAVLTFLILCALRFISRRVLSETFSSADRTNAIVVGAGHAAQLLIGEMHAMGYSAVAAVDDDPTKIGCKVRGVLVAGSVERLAEVAKKFDAQEIFIAVPSATRPQMRRLLSLASQSGLRCRTIPSLHEILSGKASVTEFRELKVEDLLGREPVQLDLSEVNSQITDQVVLVTGAAGSIGSELCRQILGYGPAALICLDQAETPLFYLQQELSGIDREKRARFCVSDYSNPSSMKDILLKHNVRIIFHAAAYKHVPMMEMNVREAVRNNVLGLLSLLNVAERCGCERFLLISTDKAVNPTSLMGCTKRVCELILTSRTSPIMRCCVVRFGNVLGSQGSVVPVFQRQIEQKGQIQVTHPDIRRFFMTIPEAVSLVLQAFAIGVHGEVLVLNMGEAIAIVDLARTLLAIHGKTEQDVPIVFTGLRPGEKLYEELFYDFEEQQPTPNKNVFRARGSHTSWPDLSTRLQDLADLVLTGSEVAIRHKLREIVPEYLFEGAYPIARRRESPKAFAQAN